MSISTAFRNSVILTLRIIPCRREYVCILICWKVKIEQALLLCFLLSYGPFHSASALSSLLSPHPHFPLTIRHEHLVGLAIPVPETMKMIHEAIPGKPKRQKIISLQRYYHLSLHITKQSSNTPLSIDTSRQSIPPCPRLKQKWPLSSAFMVGFVYPYAPPSFDLISPQLYPLNLARERCWRLVPSLTRLPRSLDGHLCGNPSQNAANLYYSNVVNTRFEFAGVQLGFRGVQWMEVEHSLRRSTTRPIARLQAEQQASFRSSFPHGYQCKAKQRIMQKFPSSFPLCCRYC